VRGPPFLKKAKSIKASCTKRDQFCLTAFRQTNTTNDSNAYYTHNSLKKSQPSQKLRKKLIKVFWKLYFRQALNIINHADWCEKTVPGQSIIFSTVTWGRGTTKSKLIFYRQTAALLCAHIIVILSSSMFWLQLTLFAEVFQVRRVHNQCKCNINLSLRTARCKSRSQCINYDMVLVTAQIYSRNFDAVYGSKPEFFTTPLTFLSGQLFLNYCRMWHRVTGRFEAVSELL
jgi:hypothetical protein